MVRRAILTALGVAAIASPPAGAATPVRGQTLMPGVVYSRQMQFTAHGPLVLNVVSAPRPEGLYSLRVALSSDCFYTLDMWGRNCPPRLPVDVYNYDTEQARASLRKLAELEPAAAWPGHAKPATGDVRAQLERAAAAS